MRVRRPAGGFEETDEELEALGLLDAHVCQRLDRERALAEMRARVGVLADDPEDLAAPAPRPED
jgi:hypothetical protein